MKYNHYHHNQTSDLVKVAVYEAQETLSAQQYLLPLAFTVAVLSAWAAFGSF